MSSSFEALHRFAAACQYGRHDYMGLEGDRLVTAHSRETPLLSIVARIEKLVLETDKKQLPLVKHSITLIRDYYHKKCPGFIFRHIFGDHVILRSAVEKLDAIIQKIPEQILEDNEESYRFRFIACLPHVYSVVDAPSSDNPIVHKWRNGRVEEVNADEWKIIEILSKKIFASQTVQSCPIEKRWDEYFTIMKGLYCGNHMLIEDDATSLLVKELANLGAIIRHSSHYEKGREVKGWHHTGMPILGGAMHVDMLKAQVPHFGLTGSHVKHVLFHHVEMSEINGELVYAKTARQVAKLIEKDRLEIGNKKISKNDIEVMRNRHFLALQFETSPNIEGKNIYDCQKFFNHCICGYLLYQARRYLFGEYEANVGPYGYGRSDRVPVVIEKDIAV